jgi:hypothetical protein
MARFRVSGQTADGKWETILGLGEARLSASKLKARDAYDSGRYVFVGVYSGKSTRRMWLGTAIRVRDTPGTKSGEEGDIVRDPLILPGREQ